MMSKFVEEAVAAASAALPELERLRGKRVLLTGGTGFIGTWLLEQLAALNDQWDEPCLVYAPTRAPQAFASKAPHLFARPEFTFAPGDVRSFAAPDHPCEYIVHAAASASPMTKEQSPVDVGDTIVDGTRRVLEMARGWQSAGVLFLSSGAIYGAQPPALDRVSEDYTGGPDLTRADATYGEGKRYAEALCGAYQRFYGVPVAIARPFTFIAPYLDLNAGFAATDFLRDALAGGPLDIKGDGTTVRSYAGPVAMLSMLWGVLLRGTPGRAYNVGAEEAVSVAELAYLIARTCTPAPEVHIAQQPTPGRFPARYVPDMSRMRDELGLQAREELDDLVRGTMTWFRAQTASAPRS
ncbi:MAG TPA: NAD-dependent epimerase/dehydratase family protein [Ktedonobacterales bacterium]|nr:NAD-dependent epimerase/dehydratase family protein [Ktedonobacterales bacterium]